ncbi:MAG: RNA 2',3'-cyclic phosphodiesterase [Candidatus Sericytochromatia bacterium]
MSTPEIPETKLRLFTALPMPERVLKACGRLQSSLKPDFLQLEGTSDRVRWSRTENLHLTLNFLGDTSSELIPELLLLLEEVAARTPVLDLTLHSLDAFPKLRQAHVLVWRMAENEALNELYTTLSNGMAVLGILPEPRPYRPHLTLARIKPPQPLAELPKPTPLSFESTHVVLFQSVLRPEGPEYTALGQALFRA